ncbi:DUF2275 domain-containing protein [Geomobilimonas luticola]|uniref:DUF2275 domain-containing protein n=1 Tax=Geomobilimonas luticola TaxID=1114878 RepID=A0ABS5SH93_9BACT|nr:DUF2275 domain-containing protein [Geomobilimonas luticola]MBT0654738.1 DUF2275 domain-containing protein [Geomobilimonas luticola]
MEHTEIRRRLSDYLDNVVSAKEKSEIEAHLATCGNCRGALADLERTVAHLKSLPEVEPPPWMTAKIMARVKGGVEPKPALWKRLFFPLHVKLPLEAVAIVFLCITGYYLARTTAPQVPLTDTPAIIREEAPQLPPGPPPKQQPSAPPVVSPPPSAKSPVAPGAPAVAPPPVTERGGYAPPPPTAAPLPSLQPAAPSPPAYPVPMPGSGQAARRSKAEAPQAEAMRDAAPFRESDMMEMRKGAREEIKAFEGLRQPEERVPAAVMEKSASPAPSAKYRQEPTGEGREKIEITLLVDDPAGAVGAIEEAVVRARGRIVRRTYGATAHELLARFEARDIPALVARLERVGVLRKPPQLAARDGETVELRISW